jgi:hypothetical protein
MERLIHRQEHHREARTGGGRGVHPPSVFSPDDDFDFLEPGAISANSRRRRPSLAQVWSHAPRASLRRRPRPEKTIRSTASRPPSRRGGDRPALARASGATGGPRLLANAEPLQLVPLAVLVDSARVIASAQRRNPSTREPLSRKPGSESNLDTTLKNLTVRMWATRQRGAEPARPHVSRQNRAPMHRRPKVPQRRLLFA